MNWSNQRLAFMSNKSSLTLIVFWNGLVQWIHPIKLNVLWKILKIGSLKCILISCRNVWGHLVVCRYLIADVLFQDDSEGKATRWDLDVLCQVSALQVDVHVGSGQVAITMSHLVNAPSTLTLNHILLEELFL